MHMHVCICVGVRVAYSPSVAETLNMHEEGGSLGFLKRNKQIPVSVIIQYLGILHILRLIVFHQYLQEFQFTPIIVNHIIPDIAWQDNLIAIRVIPRILLHPSGESPLKNII